MIVAIDGPAGAGKSTVALRAAEALGLKLISTGALYRAVAREARERGVSWDDVAALVPIARSLDVEFEAVSGVNRVRVGGVDMTAALRTPEVSSGASIVSAHGPVRDALTELQRDFGRRWNVVMEGRDIGTVIFPDADVKIFLTATSAERARRRMLEYAAAGRDEPFEAVLADIEERDLRDSTREVAPLRPAPDSVLLDCTHMDIDEVVGRIVEIVQAASRASG